MDNAPLPARTLLGDLIAVRPEAPAWRYGLVGFAYTAISALLCLALGFPEAGVFTVFLAAAALAGPFTQILDENRDGIWVHQRPAWQVNRRTTLCVLALFSGMVIAFVSLAVWLGADGVARQFRFAMQAAGLSSGDILSRSFGTFGSLTRHNLTVMGAAAIFAFVFRSYGALLALGWNAAVWGIVLTLLVMRGVDSSAHGGLVFVATATAAVLPHLIAEAAGYVLAALAAIFLSKGLARYDLGEAAFWRVGRAALLLLAVAVGLLLAAAALEQSFAPWLLGRLKG